MAGRESNLGLFGRMFAPARVDRAELIDAIDVQPSDLERCFADLRHINRYLGGTAVVRRELDRLLPASGKATLLDLGTGTADIPLSLIKRAKKRGGAIEAVGLDANSHVIRFASREVHHKAGLHLVAGDAGELPFADGSFDFVTSSLTFHHLSDAFAIDTLREMYRVARKAVIVNDLRRGYLPAALIWIVTRLTLMNRLTRHDGPLSVMRSRTLEEYRELAAKAGLSATVRAHPFWRASLVIVKETP